ncbi:hypothetical protein PTSG_04190 [Salpingoeca rosetta]|uniref:Uncharacterized protein n=1 Tax=Salpingoeca rosetta (strain ATCC 50818 / BSB-021) TaxID=946362 RepID=F2U6V1_SALR5|nr:uncharacterized protein PTSG_04190 [Salpingoeca rosetta]EGD83583.1 hypothetical protein PTSG_04190 [Salpingoeca rosetta]|eukprot:XP_004995087.1 hypothetical protein PTSG_04190 [Salpingoeca rosetta]
MSSLLYDDDNQGGSYAPPDSTPDQHDSPMQLRTHKSTIRHRYLLYQQQHATTTTTTTTTNRRRRR